MADNTTLNPGTGGDTVRDIDRATIKTQVAASDIGGASGEYLVDAGRTTGSLTAVSSVTDTNAKGCAAGTVVVSGTYAGIAVVIEASIDGATFVQLQPTNLLTGEIVTASPFTLATNATAALQVAIAGFEQWRVRATTYTSGTANVVMSAEPGVVGAVSVQGPTRVGQQNITGNPLLLGGTDGFSNAAFIGSASSAAGVADGSYNSLFVGSGQRSVVQALAAGQATLAQDLSAYRSVVVQVFGPYVGAVLFQCSVDNSSWVPMVLQNVSTGAQSSQVSDGITANWSGPLMSRYFRVFCLAANPATGFQVQIVAQTMPFGPLPSPAGRRLEAATTGGVPTSNIGGREVVQVHAERLERQLASVISLLTVMALQLDVVASDSGRYGAGVASLLNQVLSMEGVEHAL